MGEISRLSELFFWSVHQSAGGNAGRRSQVFAGEEKSTKEHRYKARTANRRLAWSTEKREKDQEKNSSKIFLARRRRFGDEDGANKNRDDNKS